MGERATGVLVPELKDEPAEESPLGTSVALQQAPEDAGAVDVENYMLCPICKQIISSAFLTACGHSFCYLCIVTHLSNKSDCPSCGHYLTSARIFPNLLLDKLLKGGFAHQIAKSLSPFEHLRQALQQGYKVSIKELDGLLSLLVEKKGKMEQEEAETNAQILLDFLHRLREKKIKELNEIQADLQHIKEDINAVQRYRTVLYQSKQRLSSKLRMFDDDPITAKARAFLADKQGSGTVCSAHHVQGLTGSQNKRADVMTQVSSRAPQINEAFSSSDLQSVAPSVLTISRKRRHSQFGKLHDYYLQKRPNSNGQSHKQGKRDTNTRSREGYSPDLDDFLSVLTTFTQYSQLRVVAELRHNDIFHSASFVSSIEFDRDDELFATAGVSRRIKVFEFSSVMNEPADVHCPVAEMSSRSKLICLSWNKYTKNYIASSDYEGIVTVWDVNNCQSVMEYEEHEKRAWSIDFSRTEPSMLVSGGDDCKVKVWCLNQEASVLNIDMTANICSVKYNPGSSIYVAVGSADHHVRYYDLRYTSNPLHVFRGHEKAVSYVKFLSNNELASASTDSTLRLWDVEENMPLRTYRGHMNEKYFVGLSVNSKYIACGSETEEVFVYHKAVSKPMASHRFDSSESDDNNGAGTCFISGVCWKNDSPTMLTANSEGTIKVLVLAA